MFHLCVAQSPAELATVNDRLAWLETILPRVTQSGAHLLLLPELFACGYNIGNDLVARAEPADGAIRQHVSRLAGNFGVAMHYGFAETAQGAFYNSALCIAPDGRLLCHQRKLAIPPGFERRHFSAGAGCRLFQYCGLQIATLICYDAEFPETVRHVAARGADLVLVPTALGAQWPWVAETMIPTRAYENGLFLAYANSAGTENGLEYLGASVIAAPDGTELARAGRDPELLFANLDKRAVDQAQKRLPYLKDRSAIQL